MADQDYFVALTECHFMNPQTMSEIGYYPGMARWWASVDGVMRAWSGRDLSGEWPHPLAEELIKYMDEARVDVCFCLREPMMDITGGTVSMSTNGFMMQQIAPYPGRMYLEANCGPVIRRGLEHAIWELEYLVKERDAKLCKMYQPEDAGPINDKRLWPFYAKAEELGVPLTVHTGQLLRGAAARFALRCAPARRCAARIPGPEDHRLPRGLARHRSIDRSVRQAHESLYEPLGDHRLV